MLLFKTVTSLFFLAFPTLLAWKHGHMSFTCLKCFCLPLENNNKTMYSVCVWWGEREVGYTSYYYPWFMGSPLLSWCQQDWNLCKIVRLYFRNVFQIHSFFTSTATTTHQDYYASFPTGLLPFLTYLKSTFQKATVMFFRNVSWIIPCLKQLLFLQSYAHFPCTSVTLVPQI